MIIYHGHPSKPSLEKARNAAPSYRHGAEFSDKAGARRYDEPYIIDNGAFAAHKNDEEWDGKTYLELLSYFEAHDRDPDFAIVPDVVGDANATFERSGEWADNIPFETYQPVQDGMGFDEAIEFALETDSSGIFVGGSTEWKRRTARDWVVEGHKAGLKVHIGRPGGVSGILAAERWGADSVDTTSFVAWAEWGKLREIEEQRGLTDF